MSEIRVHSNVKTFIWDSANTEKNWLKHKVKPDEAEEPFFDIKRMEYGDLKHSGVESRHIVVGLTKEQRLLYVAYTMRGGKIRVISACDVNRRERKIYEETT